MTGDDWENFGQFLYKTEPNLRNLERRQEKKSIKLLKKFDEHTHTHTHTHKYVRMIMCELQVLIKWRIYTRIYM